MHNVAHHQRTNRVADEFDLVTTTRREPDVMWPGIALGWWSVGNRNARAEAEICITTEGHACCCSSPMMEAGMLEGACHTLPHTLCAPTV